MMLTLFSMDNTGIFPIIYPSLSIQNNESTGKVIGKLSGKVRGMRRKSVFSGC